MKKDNILYRRIEIPQHIKAIVLGLLVIFGTWILTNIISFKLDHLTTSYPYNFDTHKINIPPYVELLYWIPYILRVSAPVLAGIIIGKMMKKEYFKYSVLLGIVVGIFPALLILTYLLWPDRLLGKEMSEIFVTSFVYKHVLRQLFTIPKTMLMVMVGGYISSKLSWSKIIRNLIIVVIALICLFFIYLSTSKNGFKREELPSLSKQEASNWIQYTHPKLGFSIKYPSNIVIVKEFPEGVIFTRQSDSRTNSYIYSEPNLQILLRNGKSLTDALDSETPKCSSCSRPAFDNVTINNAIGLRPKTGFASAYEYYLIDKNNHGPVIRVSLSGNEGPDINNFKKMIGTIEFTNDTMSLPTPKKGWKWYVSKKYNIAFQYPEAYAPDDEGRVFTSGDTEFRVLIDDTTPNRIVPALEPASSQVIINNTTWNVKDSYTYCDGGTCTSTGPTYYIYKDGHLVRVKYFQDDVWPVVEQVISSLVFNAQRNTIQKSNNINYIEPSLAVTEVKNTKWINIANTKYSYSIDYPSWIDESDSALRQPTLAREVYLNDFRIFVDDANGMTLTDYVNKAWTNNQGTTNTITPYKKAGSIEETVISGTKGYQFTLTHSIAFGKVAEKIDGTYILRFAKKGSFIYLIAYPVNNSEYQKIADTFTLLK